jgi:hypothetical protein
MKPARLRTPYRALRGIPRYCFATFAALLLFASSAMADTPASEQSLTNASSHWHTVSIEPGPDHPTIRTRDKFNPLWWFKNADDPLTPESYRPKDKHRQLKWRLRNPLHNFTFYVVGVADKRFSSTQGVRPGPKESYWESYCLAECTCEA